MFRLILILNALFIFFYLNVMIYSQINFSLENIMNKKQIRTIFLFPVETRKAIEINEDNERTYCKMVVQKISKSLEDDECGNASNPGRMR